jgi:Holliday junction resolvase
MENENLYDFTPAEFERLVAELLSESGFTDVRIVGGPGDQGVDILCVSEGKEYAVQVKHKKSLNKEEVRDFLTRYCSNPSVPRSLIYATSADIPRDVENLAKELPNGCVVRFMGREKIFQMLSQQRSTASRFYASAMLRLKSERVHSIIGIVLAIISTVGLVLSTSSFFHKEKAPLNQQIESVEKTLVSMRDLEAQLNKIKKDMVETEKATQIINEKHAKAKELEKLTEAQLETLKNKELIGVRSQQSTEPVKC